jgi:hypothetical protein
MDGGKVRVESTTSTNDDANNNKEEVVKEEGGGERNMKGWEEMWGNEKGRRHLLGHLPSLLALQLRLIFFPKDAGAPRSQDPGSC